MAVLVTLSAFAAGELFAARAAFLQVGAMLGTIMAANVFFVIIPAHWELVRAKQQGREPDPAPGLRAKQRSVHNNYLTLPVVFTMLAGHFPLAFGQRSRVARPARDLRDRGGDPPLLQPLARGAAGVVDPRRGRRWERWRSRSCSLRRTRRRIARPSPTPPRRRSSPPAAWSATIGSSAPAGVQLDTLAGMRANAAGIQRLVSTNAMPPGNVTGMTDAERDTLVAWAAAAR